ncbi:Metal homeostasis factor ATX1 [Leucoagaricus sp. SymC.cos]|nr:Metal homeostasis factor ATX1 [Leucoagaricus sp. SymC.cos]
MNCGGCSAAINRVLTKAKAAGDVTEFDVSLESQQVIVKTTKLNFDSVREKIAKTGKEVGYQYTFYALF